MPLVKSGHLRVLAVTGSSRSPAMPDLPTVAETVPGFDVTPWYGLLAPAGTPDAVIQFIYQEVADIIAKPEMRQYMLDQGLEPKTMKPAEFSAFLDREVDKWSDVVRRAKVTALE
jgi:tripartite-type tricarboxylate transporter receptor subunit TctC